MKHNFRIYAESDDKTVKIKLKGDTISLAVGVSILITDICKQSNIDVDTFIGGVKELMCQTTKINFGGVNIISIPDDELDDNE